MNAESQRSLRAAIPPRVRAFVLGMILTSVSNAQPEATGKTAASVDPGSELFELGRQIFEQYAPPEIKAEFEFPSKQRWDEFSQRLQGALEGDSLQDLAVYLPEARVALKTLRAFPDYGDYSDWLEQRVDEIEG